MDLREKLPEAKQGENACAAFRIWSDSEEEKLFEMACFGPARLYVAGEMVFQSSVTEEVNVKHKKAFPVQLKRGWNDFIFCFSSTASVSYTHLDVYKRQLQGQSLRDVFP